MFMIYTREVILNHKKIIEVSTGGYNASNVSSTLGQYVCVMYTPLHLTSIEKWGVHLFLFQNINGGYLLESSRLSSSNA